MATKVARGTTVFCFLFFVFVFFFYKNNIDRGRHLEKQRKRLRRRGGGREGGEEGRRNPSTSPLKSVFDSSQLSGSINVQDGETITLFLNSWIALQNTPGWQARYYETKMMII